MVSCGGGGVEAVAPQVGLHAGSVVPAGGVTVTVLFRVVVLPAGGVPVTV